MDKSWKKPWSMDEIISQADNWNLAGDVALLNTLKAFADNILTKTTEIDKNLMSLTDSLEETNLRLNVAQNEFQSLRNTQFIESRVYEDDETLPRHASIDKPPLEEKSDEGKVEEVRFAVFEGLKVLEKYFDKIDVNVSDNDDDDDDDESDEPDANLPNYILRAKDLYTERPLPYVIGSDEWHKSVHVGLDDSASDTEKNSDGFSESESEEDLPIVQQRTQVKGSDSGSELEFSQRTKMLNREISRSSGSEVSTDVAVSADNFAEQLAAKLGHVVTQESNVEPPEVNKRPLQQTTSQYSDLFFDEPPPLDENRGLFSGGKGLFDNDDDDDDDLSYSTPKKTKRTSPKQVYKSGGGLFDEDSDDDIFGTKKIGIQGIKPPAFIDEPPAIDAEKKKPTGGVSIFGGGNLFDKKLLKSPDDEKISDKTKVVKQMNLFDDSFKTDNKFDIPKSESVKKVDLFGSDEEGSLFGDDSVKSVQSKSEAKPSPLFDIDIERQEEEEEDRKQVGGASSRLFEKDDDDLFNSDLFSSSSTKKITSSLFGNLSSEEIQTTITNKFPDDIDIEEETKSNVDEPIKPRLSLFDSPPPEPDDLFADKTSQQGDDLFSDQLFTSNLFEKNTTRTSSSIRLFDPSPPPDDGDDAIEPKSDTLSECDDITTDDLSPVKTSIFGEEPPVEEPRETYSSKPGKIQHNLNINVGALMPGSLPPKRVEKISSDQSFESVDGAHVLCSVTKDRARVPLRRRPSTRKGRQAALRSSTSDFMLDHSKDEAVLKEEQPVSSSLVPENKSREDFFDFEQPIVEVESKDEKLFVVEAPKTVKMSLFDDDNDDDDDDNLFSGKKPQLQATKSLTKSLFDDDNDEDDDIFKNFSSKKPE